MARSARNHSARAPRRRDPCSRVRSIDGRHPLQRVAPSAVVPYPARRRRDGRISYFNFDLAREMGLLAPGHPDRLDARLENALLDTFSLVIINEWDQAHGRLPAPRDRCPHPYMATRYLQLQHPDRRGLNSGDGRSIWNGLLSGPGGEWDVSSCGTGVTRLCPATSATGRYFRTGSNLADYGCGTAHVEEGLGAALMSEAFARVGVRTERVLAVISLPSGFAINVRAAPNLLRPSHFFGLLRRGQIEDLRRCVLYYAEREIRGGRWPALRGDRARIRHLAERVGLDFARAAATFESEYIFCWLDWDGDNILVDGSILDYGSVRQFGLYHRSYRFQDIDRMSTSLPEQRRKARQIVQRFVQIRDLLLHGSRPPLASLSGDPLLTRFDDEFERHRRRRFLHKLGLDDSEIERVTARPPAALARLMQLHRRLERRRSSRGPHRVPDGLSWNAVYCMRDILRELPRRLSERLDEPRPWLDAAAFYEIALSNYASRRDRARTPYRDRLAREYQQAYLALAAALAHRCRIPLRRWLEQSVPRAERRNPYARMTGDGLTHAAHRLARSRHRLAPEEVYRLVAAFASTQDPARTEAPTPSDRERPLVKRLFDEFQQLAEQYREHL